MTTLSDSISVVGRFARSANLERDIARAEPLEGYVVTARALDVVERIAHAGAGGSAGGAWSVTGPYGSGKSSLALLVDAALSGPDEPRPTAWDLINRASPAVAKLVRQTHERYATSESGFHRGLVTASREPLSHTVLRALNIAVTRSYGKIPSVREFSAADTLRGALEDAAAADPRRNGPAPTALVEIARCLAADRPLLLIIDEFGKNLEAFRDGAAADPYLLQQLAEAGQSEAGLPIFLLTLQHLSFEDYLGGSDRAQRREWAKVQGRFEDIPYVESATQTRALIGTVFETTDRLLQSRINRWARPYAKAMRSLGIAALSHPDVVASCYPLHPLAALVLPELCNRYGQHERTLFSYLAGADPSAVPAFLSSAQLKENEPLPSVGVDAIYEYFVSNSAPGALQSSRWIEVAIRLRDAHGLSRPQEQLAKAVALLNLVSATGTIRASQPVLELIDADAAGTLSELEEAGIVTYREFADEYRIWHGTDVNIREVLQIARLQVQQQSLVEILAGIDDPSPVVAARHSAEHHMLRVFRRRYATSSENVEPLDAFSPYDGEVLLLVDKDGAVPTLTHPSVHLAKPVVAALPHDVTALDSAARELAALDVALRDSVTADDWVARQELGERMAQARATLDSVLAGTFGVGSCRWVLLRGEEDDVHLTPGRGSAPISAAADRAYPHTPIIPNEMLNRTALTSQGAKARRMLLEAMINHGNNEALGISGYGPEMAMYRAFLERTELHGPDARNHTMTFRSPSDESLRPAWEMLMREFGQAKKRRINLRDIYTILISPPIGMKAAVIPVFVTAALLARSDEIAIYEHGTFKPLLTAEMSQRMVRNPSHFDIKHFANTSGVRREVIDSLALRLGVRPRFRKHRVANVLAIVGHLVTLINSLDNYTRRTHNLTSRTIALRDVLLAAVEPDDLLFVSLPEALGLPGIGTDLKSYAHAPAYARAVGEALEELTTAHDHVRDGLLNLLFSTSAETSRDAIAGQAASLADEVLDPTVRSFVLTLSNKHIESDLDWIDAIATVVAQKAPAEWRDDDRQRCENELPQKVAAFRRLVALHSQHRADGGGAFEALRVTLTRPDGREDVRMVSFDHRHRDQLSEALDVAIECVAGVTGSPQRAQEALLALIGERLVPSRDVSADGAQTTEQVLRWVQHG